MGCGRENKGHIKDENLHWKLSWFGSYCGLPEKFTLAGNSILPGIYRGNTYTYGVLIHLTFDSVEYILLPP